MAIVELLLESWQANHRDSRIDLSQPTHHSFLALMVLKCIFRILHVQGLTSIMVPLGGGKP